MLSYEPRETQRFGLGRARVRLTLLRYIQNRSLRDSAGVIFLTDYAARIIQQSSGPVARVALIPHGVASAFKRRNPLPWPKEGASAVRCLYVSDTAVYKHQGEVVKAISSLRHRGYSVQLTLAGGGAGPAQRRLLREIALSDPEGRFIQLVGFVPPDQLPDLLAGAHLFVFASSCENMPNTLVEAMAVGLPIACSRRGPMPEVLGDGGHYFDPEDTGSIATSLAEVIDNADLRHAIARRAKARAERSSWARCARETFDFLRACALGEPGFPARG